MAYKHPVFPMAIAVFIIVLVLFEYFEPTGIASPLVASVTTWATIIVTGIVWVGLVSIIRVWTREVRRRTPGRWYHAVYGLFLIIVMVVTGLGTTAYEKWGTHPTFAWIWSILGLWSASAHMAAQGFWTVGGIYRAFRARSVESVLFLIAGTIVMLGASSIGPVITPSLPLAGRWITLIPYKASMMAITIGLGIGIIAYTIRFIVGKEMTALGVALEEVME